MKTLKSIFKDLLKNQPDSQEQQTENATNNRSSNPNETQSQRQASAETVESEINQNQNQNETETDEMAGADRMDNPDSPGTVENSQGTETEIVSDQKQSNSEGECGGASTSEVEEAYRKGYLEGRNSKIEETYFPKTQDGVPEFNGSPAKFSQLGDIFSIAREA